MLACAQGNSPAKFGQPLGLKVMLRIWNKIVRTPAPTRRINLIGIMAACLGFCLAARGQSSVSLMWNADTGPRVAGYFLHIGNAPGIHPATIDVGTNVVVALSGLTNGVTYYFVVAAHDPSGVEGLPSNEAVFSVPAGGPAANSAPQITAINPGSAAAGAPVDIYGAGFTGAASVQFNGVNASFTVSSDTLIIATVPAGATSGLVKVTSPNGSITGPFTVTPTPAPANDNFASAQVLTGGLAMAATGTTGATKQSGEPNHAGNAGGSSVWYRWTAPATGAYSLDTVGSDFNTLLAAYTGGSLTGLSVVASNRIATGSFTNALALNAAGGVTYQIAVDGVNGATGNAALHLTPITQTAATVTVYSNSFESTDGFGPPAGGGSKRLVERGHGHQRVPERRLHRPGRAGLPRLRFFRAGNQHTALSSFELHGGHQLAPGHPVLGDDGTERFSRALQRRLRLGGQECGGPGIVPRLF